MLTNIEEVALTSTFFAIGEITTLLCLYPANSICYCSLPSFVANTEPPTALHDVKFYATSSRETRCIPIPRLYLCLSYRKSIYCCLPRFVANTEIPTALLLVRLYTTVSRENRCIHILPLLWLPYSAFSLYKSLRSVWPVPQWTRKLLYAFLEYVLITHFKWDKFQLWASCFSNCSVNVIQINGLLLKHSKRYDSRNHQPCVRLKLLHFQGFELSHCVHTS